MSAFNWIKKLKKDERGNVLLVGAATMPLLMGSAALAIDTVQLTLWNRQLQRSADSAAIAGAYALAQGASMNTAVNNDLAENIDTDLALNEKPSLTNTDVAAGSYGEGEIDPDSCDDRGLDPCYNQAVQVTLTAQRSLPFLRMFTNSVTTLEAEATAALVMDGEYCMVSTYDGEDPGIVGKGGVDLNLSCGIAVNATGEEALLFNGNPTIRATPVSSVGGISGGDHFLSPTTLQPYSLPVRDPFGHVDNQVAPATCGGALNVKSNEYPASAPLQMPAGSCWESWDIDGHVNLAAGTHYVKGGLFDLKGTVTCTGCTIVLSGDGSQFRQNGGGTLDITAPTSGDLKGIAIFRDRDASNDTANKLIKINGGAGLKVTGAIYTPNTDIEVGGNATFDTSCLQMVGRKLDFQGNVKITNSCPTGGPTMFGRPVVRLVS